METCPLYRSYMSVDYKADVHNSAADYDVRNCNIQVV